MTVETAAKTISLILAPVVMLSACGILYFALDIRLSHQALQYETLRVAALVPPDVPSPAHTD